MSTKTQQVVYLVKIKSWYLPKDAQSYDLLKKASVPLLIFHKDFLPTLQLATRRASLRAKEVLWSDVYNERMTKVGVQWKSKPGRTCKLGDSKLVFLAKSTASNRTALAALEGSLQKFFARWAFKYYPVFSETASQLKLVVDIKFDPGRLPVTPIELPEQKRIYELVLGFSKVRLSFYDKDVETLRKRGLIAPLVLLEMFTQAGTEWQLVHQSTTKPSQIGDITGFIPGVAELFSRMKVNSD